MSCLFGVYKTKMVTHKFWEATNYKVWGLQKDLQKQRIPTEGDIKVIAANIPDERTRALFILLYLTGGRISEIVFPEGLKKKNLDEQYRNGRAVLLLNIPNRKHRTRHFKDIPIPIDKEFELLELLRLYLQKFRDDDVLFDFGKIRAYQLLRGATGWNCHWIRHIRLTHLVLYHDFNEQLLIQFAGWTNSLPAKNYMELRWTNILDKY
jgi:integrase